MCSEPSQRRSSLWTGVVLALALMPFQAALASAQALSAPRMVADLNTQPSSGDAFPSPYYFQPPEIVDLRGILYFAAADPVHGLELWRSDGTPEGTRLVRDIHPGSRGAELRTLTVHQERLYFYADDGVWGSELWTSDGTREGTRLVRDACPGPCSIDFRGAIASAGDRLYFLGGPLSSLELWRTDGSREGTRRVADLCPAPCTRFLEGKLTGLSNGRVLFLAAQAATGVELWGSDGTPEGTRPFDLSPGLLSSTINDVTALGDRGLFWRYGISSHDLWVTDGTLEGTRMVRAGVERPSPHSEPRIWKDALYFASFYGEFWRTDGTGEGTALLMSFPIDANFANTPYLPTRLTPLADSLLFIAGDAKSGLALWRTRGTPATTQRLRDPQPGIGGPDMTGLHRAGNRAFFFTRTIEGRIELWTSDGRTARTQRLTTLCGQAADCGLPYGTGFLGAGGLSFFLVRTEAEGGELWRSDGTVAGTFRVRDIHQDPGSSLGTGLTVPDSLWAGTRWIDFGNDIAPLNGNVLFPARQGEEPATLWRSDGTAAGTTRVEAEPTWPNDFLRHGDHLYFLGAYSDGGGALTLRRRGLWRTDGTAAGTVSLGQDLYDSDLLASAGDFLFFAARDTDAIWQGTGVEPWRSDGTPSGTRQIADIDQQVEVIIGSPPLPLPGSSLPGVPVRLGGLLLFAADDGLTGRELWATDGTAAGTRQVRNIDLRDTDEYGEVLPGSEPDSLVRLGGVVLFTADDGAAGRELWVSDGTEAGTRRLRDLRPGVEGSVPHDLVEHGGLVWFFASATGQGEALWRTDGTEAGTVPVKSLARRGLPSWGAQLTAAGGRLFFVAANEATGPELQVSNGTAAGTRMLQIRPGHQGAYPQSFTVMNGRLIFAADDGAHGLEPWTSDGTPAGTRSLGDLSPGPNASSPMSFTVSGGRLFFGADDGMHGRELWVVE